MEEFYASMAIKSDLFVFLSCLFVSRGFWAQNGINSGSALVIPNPQIMMGSFISSIVHMITMLGK